MNIYNIMQDQNNKKVKNEIIKAINDCLYPPLSALKSQKEREKRKDQLIELSKYFYLPEWQNQITENIFIANFPLLFKVFENNMFRKPKKLQEHYFNSQKFRLAEVCDRIEEFRETQDDFFWEVSLQCHQLFIKLLVSEMFGVKSLKIHVSQPLVHNILELMVSQNKKQSHSALVIFSRLYAKLVPRRKLMRKTLNNYFASMSEGLIQQRQVGDQLRMLCSIASGFAVPLRQEHVIFFQNTILPLHKCENYYSFSEELSRCCSIFASKDTYLANRHIQALLRYWPTCNSEKETLFLQNLVQLIEVANFGNSISLVKKIFFRVARCAFGQHLYVSDQALTFFQNDNFLHLFKTHRQLSFKIFVHLIEHFAENHWHKVLKESFCTLKQIIRQLDSQLYLKTIQSSDRHLIYLQILQPQALQSIHCKSKKKWAVMTERAIELNPLVEQYLK